MLDETYHTHGQSNDCLIAILFTKIERIEQLLININKQGTAMAQLTQDMRTLISKFDEATTAQATELARISARFTELLAQVAGGITPEEGAALVAEFQKELDDQAVVTAELTALGKDPNNPVPNA